MATYANSEATRTALIMAAGELFAERGVDAVTTRAIAKRAGESLGVINYHFGNKEGLLKATLDYAVELWTDDPLGKLLEERRELLGSVEGRRELLAELVASHLQLIFNKKAPAWSCTLAFQAFQRDLPVAEAAFQKTATANFATFMKFYRAATQDDDAERAYCWALSVTSTPVLAAVNPLLYPRILQGGKPSPEFQAKFQAVCVDNALSSLGLKGGV